MAIILACDGCGKQSPDERGERIADNWVSVTAQTQAQEYAERRRPATKYCFCEDCVPSVLGGVLAEDLGVISQLQRG